MFLGVSVVIRSGCGIKSAANRTDAKERRRTSSRDPSHPRKYHNSVTSASPNRPSEAHKAPDTDGGKDPGAGPGSHKSGGSRPQTPNLLGGMTGWSVGKFKI